MGKLIIMHVEDKRERSYFVIPGKLLRHPGVVLHKQRWPTLTKAGNIKELNDQAHMRLHFLPVCTYTRLFILGDPHWIYPLINQ